MCTWLKTENESAKLNLNTLAEDDDLETNSSRERLLLIPSMTQEIADSILDWLDEDNTPREFGAEETYYQALIPPYTPRNGPLNSLDELLMVAGVTPELLYGLDSNRNYLTDLYEQPQVQQGEPDNSLGQLNRARHVRPRRGTDGAWCPRTQRHAV